MIRAFVLVLLVILTPVWGASKSKPHGHQGLLEPYSGKPLPVHLTNDQKSKLEKGEAVRGSFCKTQCIVHSNVVQYWFG